MLTFSTECSTLSLHDALPISGFVVFGVRDVPGERCARTEIGPEVLRRAPFVAFDDGVRGGEEDRKSTRLNSSHVATSYAVFCLKKKKGGVLSNIHNYKSIIIR